MNVGYLPLAGPPQSATTARRHVLSVKVHHFFADSEGTCGYRPIHAEPVDEGSECSPGLVRHILPDGGLVACQPSPFISTTDADVEA